MSSFNNREYHFSDVKVILRGKEFKAKSIDMAEPFITTEDVKKYIIDQGRPVVMQFSLLRFPFGFKDRVDGLAIAVGLYINPATTEEELQYLPDREIKRKIEEWCSVNAIFFNYDHHRDRYIFEPTV